MPRLPSYVDLGEAPSARSGRAIAEVDLTGVARGVRDFGSGLQDAGRTLFAEARRNQSETDDIETARARAAWSTGRVNLEGSFRPDDPNYSQWTQRYTTEAERIRQEAAAGIRDPQRRERFLLSTQPEVATGAQRVQTLVQGRDRDTGIAATNQTLTDLREAALRETDEAKRAQLIRSGSQAIDNAIQRGFFTPEQGRSFRQRWTQDYATAALMAMPAEQRADALRTPARSNEEIADRIIGVESRGVATAQNPNSTARGAGQFIDRTWLGMINQYRPDLAEGRSRQQILALRDDPQLSRFMTIKYIEENQRTLARNNLPVTPGTTYLSHFAGPAGAVALLRNPDADAAETMSAASGGRSTPEDIRTANRFIRGMTGAQVAAWADRKMGSPAGSSQSAGGASRQSAIAEVLPTDVRQRLLAQTENEILQSERQAEVSRRQEAAAIQTAIGDDLASMERTGQGVPAERLSRERVATVMGEEGARAWEIQRSRAKRVHDALSGIESLPEGDIERRLQSLQPQPGSEGYVEDQQAYDRARQRADAIRVARAKDPALAAESISAVQEARRALQYEGDETRRAPTPESLQALVRARVAAQRQLGISNIHPITVTEGRAIARQLRTIGEDDGVGLERFMTTLRRNYGEFADDVLVSSLEHANVSRDLGVAAHAVLTRLMTASNQQEVQSALQMLSAPIPVPRPSDAQMAAEAFGGSMDAMAPPSAQQAPTAPAAPPATYDGADLRRLYEGRGNPEIVGAFEQKYGRGAASAALTDIMRRLGGSDNDR